MKRVRLWAAIFIAVLIVVLEFQWILARMAMDFILVALLLGLFKLEMKSKE